LAGMAAAAGADRADVAARISALAAAWERDRLMRGASGPPTRRLSRCSRTARRSVIHSSTSCAVHDNR
jgi:hypothetical protein